MVHSRSKVLPRHDGGHWYRQPVALLGALIFAVTMAGCVWMIVLGARHQDESLDTGHPVFGVPRGAHSSAPAYTPP